MSNLFDDINFNFSEIFYLFEQNYFDDHNNNNYNF